MQDSINSLEGSITTAIEESVPGTFAYFFTQADQVEDWLKCQPAEDMEQMARIYQAAFGGAPWFEVGQCSACGTFANTVGIPCSECSNITTEAYPTRFLIEEYFPKMLQGYLPGVLVFAYNEDGQIVGWTSGGFCQLDELVSRKYSGRETTIESLCKTGNLSPQDWIFYDNETCVLPDVQKGGFGRKLGESRLIAAASVGAETIIGRSINLPWLANKSQILNNENYSFVMTIPSGDTYQVNGVPRTAYIARKVLP